VYSLLGGRCREGALAYTHASGRDAAAVEERVLEAIERGFKVVRAQVGVEGAGLRGTYGVAEGQPTEAALPREEIWEPAAYRRAVPRLLEHLRTHLPEEIELIHDVHERLTPIEAAGLARELEPYRLFFLEDPLRPEHQESFRLIRRHTTTPLAMGELYFNKWEALPVIAEQLVDYIRCDLGHIGGITEARKIAAIAEPYGVKTAWHGPGDIGPIVHAANVHLDLAVPNFGVQEMVFFGDRVREVIPGGPTYRGGYLDVGDAPGLGTDVDEAAAAKHPYRRAYLPVTRRLDGSVHDW